MREIKKLKERRELLRRTIELHRSENTPALSALFIGYALVIPEIVFF
jgi:hypothetical protein